MSFRPALFTFIALATPAFAAVQTAPPADGTAPGAANTLPYGMGAPHICSREHYPLDASRRNAEGTVRLVFTIAIDGTLQNLTIKQSSGDASLDQAALACAAAWRYGPAMKDGKPVEMPWQATVKWSLNGGATIVDPVLKDPREPVCAEARGDPGRTTPPMPVNVVLLVSPDGDATGAGVRVSSGDKIFDAYVVSCVKQWKFRPATANGMAIRGMTHFYVTWLGAPVPPDTEPSLAGDADVCTGRTRPDGAVKPLVQFLVETDGTAKYTKIETSSGDGDYDDYAVSCVSHWTFHPATQHGHPSETGWHVTVE